MDLLLEVRNRQMVLFEEGVVCEDAERRDSASGTYFNFPPTDNY